VDVSAIVLLGCRVGAKGRLSAPAERRAIVAARSWHEGRNRRIVVAGGRRWNGIAETRALADDLVARGVDPNAILLEWWSMSTAENAHYSRRLLGPAARVAFVVTCDWHMPRAARCFEREGFEVVAVPAQSPADGRHASTLARTRERLSWWLDRAATWGLTRV
jgi:uncharacterized SAM-binding protein YcdF (DUF218 family)